MLSKILKRLELITGCQVTFGDALMQVGKEILGPKFIGIFTEPDMPIDNRLTPGTGALINKPVNEHWVAQLKDKNGTIHTFDSYGRAMGPNPVPVPTYFKQRGLQSDCGPRSLAWLYHKLA